MCRLIGICVILSYFFWQLPKIPSKVPNSFLTDFFRFIFSMFLNWNAWDSTVAVQRQMTTHGNPLYMYLRRCSVTLCFTQRTSSFKGNVVFLLELSNPYAQYISSSIWTSTTTFQLNLLWGNSNNQVNVALWSTSTLVCLISMMMITDNLSGHLEVVVTFWNQKSKHSNFTSSRVLSSNHVKQATIFYFKKKFRFCHFQSQWMEKPK